MTPVEEIIARRNKYRTGNGGAPYWLDIEVLLAEREEMFRAIAELEKEIDDSFHHQLDVQVVKPEFITCACHKPKLLKCSCREPGPAWNGFCLECDRERPID